MIKPCLACQAYQQPPLETLEFLSCCNECRSVRIIKKYKSFGNAIELDSGRVHFAEHDFEQTTMQSLRKGKFVTRLKVGD